MFVRHNSFGSLYKGLVWIKILAFGLSAIAQPGSAHAQGVLNLPVPGTLVTATESYNPTIMRGVTINPDNPLEFDFIIHAGDDNFQGEQLKSESTKLIKYFMASLTTPEDQMWVNLSPYEKDRIVPVSFGQTEMARDLLAQDYLLKQLTASLMYPEDELGKAFWKRVRKQAFEQFGTTEIPMNTFNKIWIVPEKASIYQNGTSVFVVDSHLKVMLEEDYIALEANKNSTKHGLGKITRNDMDIVSGVSSEIIREILIPEIEREVNEGATFANLRQIYHSVILGLWYKQNLKESLLGHVYVDQIKTKGIDTQDKQINQKIYDQYVEAFRVGVYDFIREDYDPKTQKVIPRKYFSGGVALDNAQLVEGKQPTADFLDKSHLVRVDLQSIGDELFEYKKRGDSKSVPDQAMVVNAEFEGIDRLTVPLKESDVNLVGDDVFAKLAVLEKKMIDSEADVRKKAAHGIAAMHLQLYNRGILELSDLERLLDHPDYYVQTEAFTILEQVYQAIIEDGGTANLNKLESILAQKISGKDVLVKVLGNLYVAQIKKGGYVPLEALEGVPTLNESASLQSAVGKAIADVHYEKYQAGNISLDEFEETTASSEPLVKRNLIQHLTSIYVKNTIEGEEVETRTLKDRITDEYKGVRQFASQGMVKVWAARVKKGLMSLSDLEDKLNDENNHIRGAMPATLADVYIDELNEGKTVNVKPLTDLEDDPDPVFNTSVRKALLRVYKVMLVKNISGLRVKLKDDNSYADPLLAEPLAEVFVEMVKTGRMPLSDLIEKMEHANSHYRRAVYTAVADYYIFSSEQGDTTNITELESILHNTSFAEVDKIIPALVSVFIAKVDNKEMTLLDLEKKLEHKSEKVQQAAIKALGHMYATRISDGEAVDISILEEHFTSVHISNRQTLNRVLTEVYIARIKTGQVVDLSFFESRVNITDAFHRRDVVDVLSRAYSEMVNVAKLEQVNKPAYEFWRNNNLNLTSPGINKIILNHVYQLDEQELEDSQAWIDNLRNKFSASDKRTELTDEMIDNIVVPTLYMLELFLPGSSIYLKGIYDRQGVESMQRYAHMLVKDQTVDVLFRLMAKFPDIYQTDAVRLVEFLSAFAYFDHVDRALPITNEDLFRPNQMFRMLGDKLTEIFQEENQKNPGDMQLKYFKDTMDAVAYNVQPYIVIAGLRDTDRFTRIEAAKRAGDYDILKDELKDILFVAIGDNDERVVYNVFESLSKIGGQRTIARLYRLLDQTPYYVTRAAHDDHGQIVLYREKVELEGYTAREFEFIEEREMVNPDISLIQETIKIIEARSNARRADKRIALSQVHDQRLPQFFEFLKEHGLEDYVVVVGGGVRDAYTGNLLNDLDINIVLPLDGDDHRDLFPTKALAGEHMYEYVIEKLGLLAEALGATVEDFLPPMESGAVTWQGMEVQYTGPILAKRWGDDVDEEAQDIVLKRSIIGDNGWLYSSSTGAALLQMAIDHTGRLYGHVEALDDFDRGVVRLAGGRMNLNLGGILRMLRLKHQFDLEISDYDYQIMQHTMHFYVDNRIPLPEFLVRKSIGRQIEKVLETAIDRDLALRQMEELGILQYVKDRIGVDYAQFGENKGGIDLNPQMIQMNISGESSNISLPVFNLHELKQLNIEGFFPSIINITPIINPALLLGIRKETDDLQMGQIQPNDASGPPSAESSFDFSYFKQPELIFEESDT